MLVENVNNKKLLISLLCSTHDDNDVNMKMIGQEDEEFRHEEDDINIVSYTHLLAREESREHIQVLSEDTCISGVGVLLLETPLLSVGKVTMRKFNGMEQLSI